MSSRVYVFGALNIEIKLHQQDFIDIYNKTIMNGMTFRIHDITVKYFCVISIALSPLKRMMEMAPSCKEVEMAAIVFSNIVNILSFLVYFIIKDV